MVVFELFKCKSCGLEVRQKRLAQRYCSERCRNGAVQNRKRRKQSRCGDSGLLKSPRGPQKRRLVPLHLEAVTDLPKTLKESGSSECQKPHPCPVSPEGLAKALRRPVVNLTGEELPPGLMAQIVRIETASNPPLLAAGIKFSVAA